jgi:nucleoside-diphosphate-sugar epimerase
MREAIAHQTKYFIAMSTISVVDHITRKVGPSELSQYVSATEDAYLSSKVAAERLLLDLRQGYSGELMILRLAYVYGPGNFAVWRRPFQFLEAGTLRLINNGSALLPLIHADDIGRYIVSSLTQRTARGYDGVHIQASPQLTTLRMVFDFVADTLGLSRAGSVPLWAAHIGATVAGAIPRRLRKGRLEMLTRARVQQFSRGYDLSAVLDRTALDDLEMTNYQDGFREMLADYVASEAVRGR